MSSTSGTKVKASKNLEEMRETAARICREYLTGAWKTISADEIELKRISGGLSNFLYYVSLPDNLTINKNNCNNNNNTSNTNCNNNINDTGNLSPTNTSKRPRTLSFNNNTPPEPKEVLLRIYGQTHGEQALETVLTDTVVFTLLSERKLGPKLHGIFPGGRIEQYIPARPLTTNELSDVNISRKIAEKMAAIHGLNIPVSKEPEWLWKTMERWLVNAESFLQNFTTKNPMEMKFAKQMQSINFRKEMLWLKSTIENEQFPVVFSHNDLQEGNILFKETKNSSTPNCTDRQRTSSTFFEDSMENFENAISLSPMVSPQPPPSSSSSSSPSPLTQSQQLPSSSTIGNNMEIVKGHGNNFSGIGDDGNNANDDGNSTINSRKRSFNLSNNNRNNNNNNQQDDCDFDNTRDSVLSGNSQNSCDNCDPELMIIDFEYCAYNYRGFDLANHFVEWTMDYTNSEFPFYHHRIEQYPNEEQRTFFIKSYLAAYANIANYEPTAEEINEIQMEILCFTCASHLFWTLWSVVNVHQEIEFGYWNYGASRVKEYFLAKEAYIKSRGLQLKSTHTLDDRP